MSLIAGLRAILAPSPPKKRPITKTDPALARMRLENTSIKRFGLNHPDIIDESVMRKLGYLPQEKEREPDALEVTLSTVDRLKKFGMLDNPRDIGSDGIPVWAQALLAGLAANPAVGEMVSRLTGVPTGSNYGRTGLTVTDEPQPTGPQYDHQLNPPVTVARIAPSSGSISIPPDTIQQPIGDTMSLRSDFAIGQLRTLDPVAAAHWFLNKAQTPEALAMVAEICEADDTEIVAVLSRFATAAPEFDGLVKWLYERPDWTVLLVHAMREISGITVRPQPLAPIPDEQWAGI